MRKGTDLILIYLRNKIKQITILSKTIQDRMGASGFSRTSSTGDGLLSCSLTNGSFIARSGQITHDMYEMNQ